MEWWSTASVKIFAKSFISIVYKALGWILIVATVHIKVAIFVYKTLISYSFQLENLRGKDSDSTVQSNVWEKMVKSDKNFLRIRLFFVYTWAHSSVVGHLIKFFYPIQSLANILCKNEFSKYLSNWNMHINFDLF